VSKKITEAIAREADSPATFDGRNQAGYAVVFLDDPRFPLYGSENGFNLFP